MGDRRSIRRAAASEHLSHLCSLSPDRIPGISGNLSVTDYAADVLAESGWEVSQTAFDYIDWPPQGDVVDPDVVGGQGLRLVTAACGKGDIGEPEATTVTSTMPPATSTDKHPPVPA